MPTVANVGAGIWVGGQLSGAEAVQLADFCEYTRAKKAPVVALLDFPRRDRVAIAKRIGVAEVLGKPWKIDDLAQTLKRLLCGQGGAISPIPAVRSA
jgi:hypothetical protein